MFGFAHPTIAKLIQEMPGAEKCTKYIRQQFVPASSKIKVDEPPSRRRKYDRKKKSVEYEESSEEEDEEEDGTNEIEAEDAFDWKPEPQQTPSLVTQRKAPPNERLATPRATAPTASAVPPKQSMSSMEVDRSVSVETTQIPREPTVQLKSETPAPNFENTTSQVKPVTIQHTPTPAPLPAATTTLPPLSSPAPTTQQRQVPLPLIIEEGDDEEIIEESGGIV